MKIQSSAASRIAGLRQSSGAILAVISIMLGSSVLGSADAATLDRIKETGHIKFGYVADARPFTYRNPAGNAEGYGVTLCERIANEIKGQLGLAELTVDWVPVMPDSRFEAVQNGRIDALCTPTSMTLSRRRDVSYSIPVFPGGARAALRADASSSLKTALSEAQAPKPVWRGSPAAKTLKDTRVAVVKGTTTEDWLIGREAIFQIGAKITPVPDYKTGVQQVIDRKADVFFGDRSGILGAVDPSASSDLAILDRMFTHEMYSLALPRGDEDFRLMVDRSLSVTYATGDIDEVYKTSFGPPSEGVRTFFRWNALPLQ
jgi:ABC-type amino acid transport substrate-binding protein